MSDILTKYFKSTFTLKSLLLQLNLKLLTTEHNEELDIIFNKLSTIIITFDFELTGSLHAINVIKNHEYEKLIYLIFCKINQNESEYFKYHLFKNKYSLKFDNSHLLWTTEVLKSKLLATENPSICYFLNENGDGYYWRKLHNTIGGMIMKYILLYSYVFRRLKNTDNMYVQVCGSQFSQIYPSLVTEQLALDNKKRNELSKVRCREIAEVEIKADDTSSIQDNRKYKTLKEAIEDEVNVIIETKHQNKLTDVKQQLQILGNRKLLIGKMMYDRNFGSTIPETYVYSSKSQQFDFLTKKLINEHVLSRIKLDKYENKNDLFEMNKFMSIIFRKFIDKFNSCPTRIFLDCYCKNAKNIKSNKSKKMKNKRKRNDKRKRDNAVIIDDDDDDEMKPSFNDFVDTKNVYSFVRRCLMYTLEYNDQNDSLCAAIVGGKENFNVVCKFIKCILGSLRYDTFTINNLLNGIKTKRISYLLPIKCDRYKRLILMSVLLWLIEDFVLILIRSCFYVTETCATNLKIYFYLKDTWKKIVNEKFNNSLKEPYKNMYNLEKITENHALTLSNSRETSGIHMGRLLPKSLEKENCTSDFRIISGSKAFNISTKRSYRVNYQFISLYQCLKYLVQKEPILTGFACPSHLNIQRSYSTFLNSTTYNRPANIYDPIKKWNFIKIDIEKCFDNINLESILYYIKNKFVQHLDNEQNLFTILKYSVVSFDLDKKHLKKTVNYLTEIHGIEQKGFYNGIQDFIDNIENNIQYYNHLQNSIFITNCIHERNINATKLENSLTICINNVLIKIHDQLFTRMNGILHGSICSRILCDLYLGRIEMDLFCLTSKSNESLNEDGSKKMKMRLSVSNEIILRIVDDYLIICDSIDRIYKIKSLLNTKLKINHAKTVEILWSKPVIAKTEQQDLFLNQIQTIIISESESDDDIEMLNTNFEHNINFLSNNSDQFIHWNGLNIDVHTLDIYLNYSKYFNTDLANRISRNFIKKNSFYEFNLKYLRLFNNLFNISLLINLRVNRIQAVIRNLIDIFALSAIRFQLLFKINAMPNEIMNDIRLQIKIILNQCYLGNHKIKSSLRDLIYDSFTSSFLLLKFICLSVFTKVFHFNDCCNKKLSKLCAVLEKILSKLNFIKCIRLYDSSFIIFQLNVLIDQQLEKFKRCKLD